uniref:Putative ovule protein n=1 Tax=Solanum chacoense TaxID=4108 RepID=A0A0V0GWJ7_SOLCH
MVTATALLIVVCWMQTRLIRMVTQHGSLLLTVSYWRKATKGKGKGKGKGGAAPGGGPPLPPVGSGPLTPHAIVAKDGSGKFKTVLEANQGVPSKPSRQIHCLRQGWCLRRTGHY